MKHVLIEWLKNTKVTCMKLEKTYPKGTGNLHSFTEYYYDKVFEKGNILEITILRDWQKYRLEKNEKVNIRLDSNNYVFDLFKNSFVIKKELKPRFSITLNEIKPDCLESSSNCSCLRTKYARNFNSSILHPKCKDMNKIYNKIKNSCVSAIDFVAETDSKLEKMILKYNFVPKSILLEESKNEEIKKAFCFIKIALCLNLYAKFRSSNYYLQNNIDYIFSFDSVPENFNYMKIRSNMISVGGKNVFLYKIFNKNVLFIQKTILNEILKSCFSDDITIFWKHIVTIYNILEGRIYQDFLSLYSLNTKKKASKDTTREVRQAIYDVLFST